MPRNVACLKARAYFHFFFWWWCSRLSRDTEWSQVIQGEVQVRTTVLGEGQPPRAQHGVHPLMNAHSADVAFAGAGCDVHVHGGYTCFVFALAILAETLMTLAKK